MTVVTTRPSSTIVNGNSTLVGAASRHVALNDDSDASYVVLIDPGTTFFTVQFANPVGPGGGAIFKDWRIRMRVRRSGSNIFSIAISQAPVYDLGALIETSANYVNPVTVTRAQPGAYLKSVPNTFQLSLKKKAGPTGDDDPRIVELYLDSIYVAKPVPVVSAPTGTITTTNRPTAIWTNTLDADGGAQTKYRVKVFSAAQYGAGGFNPDTSTATYDSGELSGANNSHQIQAQPTDLANATYRAYVRVAQDVNGVDHWSDWGPFSQFTISVAAPNPPFNLAGVSENNKARIRLEMQAGGGATTDLFRIRYSDVGPSGPWEYLRTRLGDGYVQNTGGIVTVYDYEAPNGKKRRYNFQAVHIYGTEYAFSSWVTTPTLDAGVQWQDVNQWWLKHPNHPNLNMPVTVRSQASRGRAVRRGVFVPLGAKYPKIVNDRRTADNGEVIFRLESKAERGVLDKLLDADAPAYLLQGPNAAEWRDRWLSLGDLSAERALDTSWGKYTFEGFDWQEVESPGGVIVPAWTDGPVGV